MTHSPTPSASITKTDIDPAKVDLPSAIKRFGNAASTSWIEHRYYIWRSSSSTKDRPKIQGYLHSGSFNFAWGRPCCHPDDLHSTAEEFVEWCMAQKSKFVWACIDRAFKKILDEGLGGVRWQSVQCIREDILHADRVELAKKDVRKNRLKAMHAGVSVDELKVKGPTWLPDSKVKEEIEAGLERWRASRKGTQIASSALLPWIDSRNRRYFVAKSPEGIVGICILAPIGNNAYQIKNSISFPEAPKGTSEDLLGTVIEELEDDPKNTLTFGASASENLTFEHFSDGWHLKFLEKLHRHIVEKYHLAERGQFRDKFELEPQPLFVAFPEGGLGWRGVVALMKMLRTA